MKQHQAIVKVFGLKWNTARDELGFSGPILDSTTCPSSKREFLSLVALVFDPVGLLAPALLQLKVMLREFWKAGLDRDQEILPTIRDQVSLMSSDLRALPSVTVPRWVGIEPFDDLQMHVFAAASKYASCVAVYVLIRAEGMPQFLWSSERSNLPRKV